MCRSTKIEHLMLPNLLPFNGCIGGQAKEGPDKPDKLMLSPCSGTLAWGHWGTQLCSRSLATTSVRLILLKQNKESTEVMLWAQQYCGVQSSP